MSGSDLVTLSGVPGSPYTRKMLAVLRYRRIPYRLILASHGAAGLPQPKVSLLPTFYFADAAGEMQAVTDSTPIIRRLEGMFAGRSARPSNPALALIDAIFEDYGDEWLTKAMFHYRWHFEADIARAAAVLPAWRMSQTSDAELKAAGEMISGRQIPRLRYVGSNEKTWDLIEASYVRYLDAMEAHLRSHRFLLGARPGAGDFGVYGQLTQLACFDPTPMALTLERAPRVYAWTTGMEDQTGLEPTDADWFDPAALPATVKALLAEVGRVYAPLLLANARAVQAGLDEVQVEIDGRPWVQQPFPYQAKCLMWLREEYAALDAPNRATADAALKDTGLEVLFR
ncbi:MAG: glutathione S-transferase [Phenylobacterium sp.]|uniref:glutathione S-transferase family protein n=1 Tax=Phenylobacterium sp. TaxID=1871053 RepID=UPI001A441432|nr:glutathione S-transferase C-terminal domain-containing protein [Phenylobacterium sp.]MBL8556765.1 glutathione S-transferase [Phenylobacterium sp.]